MMILEEEKYSGQGSSVDQGNVDGIALQIFERFKENYAKAQKDQGHTDSVEVTAEHIARLHNILLPFINCPRFSDHQKILLALMQNVPQCVNDALKLKVLIDTALEDVQDDFIKALLLSFSARFLTPKAVSLAAVDQAPPPENQEDSYPTREVLRRSLGVRPIKTNQKSEQNIDPNKSVPDIVQDKLIKLLTNPKERERHISLVMDENNVLRGIVYDSKHAAPEVNLNGRVMSESGRIVCRHLTDAVLGKGMKDLWKFFSTESGIRSQKGLRENKYDRDKIHKKSAFYELSKLSKFERQLSKLARILNRDEEFGVHFYSEMHAMGFGVLYKNSGAHVVKYYDPNFSNMYRRFLGDIDIISRLNPGFFIPTDSIHSYFSSSDATLIFSQEFSQSPSPILVIDEKSSKRDQVYRFLAHGWIGGKEKNLSTVINDILNDDSLSIQEKIDMLTAKNKKDTPALYLALMREHVHVVGIYVETILKTNQLSDKDKVELLMMKKHGAMGLRSILLAGCTEAVVVYAEMILESDLSPQNKMALLLPGFETLLDYFAKGTSQSSRYFHHKIYELVDALVLENQCRLIIERLSDLYIFEKIYPHHKERFVKSFLAGTPDDFAKILDHAASLESFCQTHPEYKNRAISIFLDNPLISAKEKKEARQIFRTHLLFMSMQEMFGYKMPENLKPLDRMSFFNSTAGLNKASDMGRSKACGNGAESMKSTDPR